MIRAGESLATTSTSTTPLHFFYAQSQNNNIILNTRRCERTAKKTMDHIETQLLHYNYALLRIQSSIQRRILNICEMFTRSHLIRCTSLRVIVVSRLTDWSFLAPTAAAVYFKSPT